tara:strand:+ start:179 stop:673 length:495 start_codon:yes stop_codon:yes gene_type:complete
MGHNYKIILFVFFVIVSSNAQELYKQTILSQGATSNLESGLIISQSIGQESVIGNFSNDNVKIIQGFQQPFWTRLISNSSSVIPIEITHFPNPITDNLNLSFYNYDMGELILSIYDYSGRILMKRNISVESGKSIVDLTILPSGSFLMGLQNDKINYYIKIIKK